LGKQPQLPRAAPAEALFALVSKAEKPRKPSANLTIVGTFNWLIKLVFIRRECSVLRRGPSTRTRR